METPPPDKDFVLDIRAAGRSISEYSDREAVYDNAALGRELMAMLARMGIKDPVEFMKKWGEHGDVQ